MGTRGLVMTDAQRANVQDFCDTIITLVRNKLKNGTTEEMAETIVMLCAIRFFKILQEMGPLHISAFCENVFELETVTETMN